MRAFPASRVKPAPAHFLRPLPIDIFVLRRPGPVHGPDSGAALAPPFPLRTGAPFPP